ncbi:hypothetical protein JDW19_22120 [Paenibacillus polymyxa]|jgi:hypothetical protein|uniref:Fungal lipase-like domain-containing protein n=1 Tax=Paenibacillus polymyxa TaxID=1406 RepID=A0A8I1IR74_PAEPO|nr:MULTISPECIES: hypothetical protein [Paenibacillus]KAF6573877.1 hypothetical protein G9G53_13635 [Paenibacillus sp. EKM206P]KAF6588238.1 hypothetical protein G9G52_13795 [Paenibacillus sp. EKM205P]MBM0635804.1 hypothetical protein [Paenibacillus polymyxa]
MRTSLSVNDETYKTMSELAYTKRESGKAVDELPGWKVLDTLDREDSGLAAVTFYNEETEQAVIAYRGTETDDPQDLYNDVTLALPEINRKIHGSLNIHSDEYNEKMKKMDDALGFTAFNNWMGEKEKSVDKALFGSSNQFYQAEDYAKDIQNKYKNYNFSLTGHSLGGGNAQYVAAYTGLNAVTFCAPSVISSLTPEYREKAENGEFDHQITNFLHPSDMIASFIGGGYDLHVGASYHIDNNYQTANEGLGLKERVDNTLGGPSYHSLNHYKFDKNGYVSNPLYDPVTGERIAESPRIPSDFNLMETVDGWIHQLGQTLTQFQKAALVTAATSASAGTIQVMPEHLLAVAEKWKANAQQCDADFQRVRARLSRYLHSSQSRRLQPIVTQLDSSMMEFSQWHLRTTNEFLYNLEYKIEQFIQADIS